MKNKIIAISVSVVIIALIVVFGEVFKLKALDVKLTAYTGAVEETDIVELIDVDSYGSIFGVNESAIKENIESYYGGNTVEVYGVVRSFPNKVTVYVRERLPMFEVDVYEKDGYCVPTDKDFQRNKIVEKSSVGYKLIKVNGISVEKSFNTASFRQLKAVADGFTDLGMTEEGIISFVKSVTFNENDIVIELNYGQARFTIGKNNISADLSADFNGFLAMTQAERAVCSL